MINIVTPCIRPSNLPAMAASINIPRGQFRWWIVLDGVDLPTGLTLPAEAVILSHTDSRSVSGNAQRNHALDAMGNHDGHQVLFLDDDTIMHPDWWAVISIGRMAQWTRWQMMSPDGGLYTDAFGWAPGQTDTGNHLFDRKCIGDLRWRRENYSADSDFVAAFAGRATDQRIIRRPLGIYNALCKHSERAVVPSEWLAFLRDHQGPTTLSVFSGSDPASLLCDQISAALLADATGSALQLDHAPEVWSPPIDGQKKAQEQRWACGFRNHCIREAPEADNTMNVSVLQRPELFSAIRRWSAANPDKSMRIGAPHFRQAWMAFDGSPSLSAMAEELRSGWQLFPRLRPRGTAPMVVVDATGWTGASAQREALSTLTKKDPAAQWIVLVPEGAKEPAGLPNIPVQRMTEATHWADWALMTQADTLITWGGARGFVAALLTDGHVFFGDHTAPALPDWQRLPFDEA